MNAIERDPLRRGGAPVLAGTRFPVSRLLSELASGRLLAEVADDYDLDPDLARRAVEEVAGRVEMEGA
jgi:uncharacterized protein (DUF433 family)